jgi:hypothetical protein
MVLSFKLQGVTASPSFRVMEEQGVIWAVASPWRMGEAHGCDGNLNSGTARNMMKIELIAFENTMIYEKEVLIPALS